jgi:hypothetical protein
MCFICEGGTNEQYNQHLHEQIVSRGFALAPVGSGWSHRGFVYTIGLVDSRNHPELVVINFELGRAVTVLEMLASSVVEGTRFEAGGTSVQLGAEIGFRQVRARHLRRGLMAGWSSYYRDVGRFDLEASALQVVLPDEGRCYECQPTQPNLDGDRHVSFMGPGRQARQAHLQRPRKGKR